MLKLSGIVKKYITGELTVTALKGVDIQFRENEFVSILGPSGCGKTTMLNIIGGLDRYDEGDLSINGKSTKDFVDTDWDSYRNHSIGFVFQSYNLIPHQTVLSNVELALTLSGVSKAERRKRAINVLKKVGLEDQLNKKPNQMSGGQMQRVAIARSLVNNPKILLADEPTGALDSETSEQIMALLKEIAEDRLVIMVTHNPELADEYSTRIIRLLDGRVIDDSDPYNVAEMSTAKHSEPKPKKKKQAGEPKTSMSLFTALSLSLNNLMTKKGRTFLTSFAGSIGIIGIALILALSTGFQAYIDQVQEDTLSSYPITIEAATVDFTNLLTTMTETGVGAGEVNHDLDKIYTREIMTEMMNTFSSEISQNDLKSLKKYIEEKNLADSEYVNAIKYSYATTLNIFKSDTSDGVIQVSPNAMFDSMMNASGVSTETFSSMSASYSSYYDAWTELLDNEELLHSQYNVIAGRWPEKHNEIVLIVTKNNEITDITLYALGLKDSSEMYSAMFSANSGQAIQNTETSYTYEELMALKFSVMSNSDFYDYDDVNGIWVDKSADEEFLTNQIADALELNIVGIIRPDEEAVATATAGSIGYLSSLTDYIIDETNSTQIVKQQKANPDINVFTGEKFPETVVVGEKNETKPESTTAAKNAITTKAETTTAASTTVNPAPASAFRTPSAGTLGGNGKAPSPSEIAIMSEKEIYAYIDENLTGKEHDDMKRMVELILMTYHTPDEKAELMGYLDEVMADSQFGEAMTSDAAYVYLMSQLPSAKRSMISSIIQSYSTGETPSGEFPIEPTAPDESTTKKKETTTKKAETTKKKDDETKKPDEETEPQTEEITEAVTEEPTTAAGGGTGGSIYDTPPTYQSNLTTLGVVDKDSPSMINIYPVDFESKDAVSALIDEYNQSATDSGHEEKVISYTDYIGLLLSSVTKIVNTVSYVLIAFVAISLVVSSIMIGIITYISVLERTKEIGILRSIGASKKDISRVFNAETTLVGFTAGALGIIVTLLLTIPINIIIEHMTNISGVAQLEPLSAVILVVISVTLTLIAGLIPSRIAAKKDPVEALRTE